MCVLSAQVWVQWNMKLRLPSPGLALKGWAGNGAKNHPTPKQMLVR